MLSLVSLQAYRWVGATNQLKRLWSSQLPGQIGSMALVNTLHGLAIAVSQPGATIMLVDGKTGEATHAPVATSWEASGSSAQGAATEIVGPLRPLSDPAVRAATAAAAGNGAAATTTGTAAGGAGGSSDAAAVAAATASRGGAGGENAQQSGGGAGGNGVSSSSSSSGGGGGGGGHHKETPLVGTPPAAGVTAPPLPPPLLAGSEYFATCTSAGLLSLGTTSEVKWELQIDGQLFAICKLQCTDANTEEIVACAWDGLTCIVDLHGNVVRFDLGQEVCGFIAGMYAVVPGKNVPCLIYVTLTESEINPSKILVYHDVKLNAVGPPLSLVSMLAPELDRYDALLQSRGLKRGSAAATTRALVRSLQQLRGTTTPTPSPTPAGVGAGPSAP